jgi:hypothetical protein
VNVTGVVIAVVIILVVVAIAMWYFTNQRRRRARLREQFGSEYDRTVQQYGEPGEAEKALLARAERVAALHIHPLSADQSERYGEQWRQVQARFVDDPEGAIRDADHLCNDVMRERGYPMSDFEQRAADISVDHPDVVEHYRAAHAIATDEGAGTEDMRQAMVHYRTLFEELIDAREPAPR